MWNCGVMGTIKGVDFVVFCLIYLGFKLGSDVVMLIYIVVQLHCVCCIAFWGWIIELVVFCGEMGVALSNVWCGVILNKVRIYEHKKVLVAILLVRYSYDHIYVCWVHEA